MTLDRRGLWAEIDAELSQFDEMTLPQPSLDAAGEWLRRVPGSLAADVALDAVADRRRLHRVLVQGTRCRTIVDALRTLGDALEFPGYYGQNLDAMDECLRELLVIEDGRIGAQFGDRAGRRADGILLSVGGADDFLADDRPEAGRRFFSVLRANANLRSDELGVDERGRTNLSVGRLYVVLYAGSRKK